MIYRAGALAAMVVVLSAGSCSAAKFKAIYSFCVEQDCADGAGTPNDLFYDAAKDTLYGTTWGGGEFGKGTFYSLKRNKKGKWKHSVLFAFPCDTQCPGGYSPGAGLIRDKDGNFYSTSRLGAFGAPGGVFKLVRAGKSWTEVGLYDFCQQPSCADGGSPEGLTYAGEAQGQPYDEVSPLYGVTAMGGGHGDGEVYSLTPNGDGWTFSVIYSFLDSGVPFGALTMDANENLFGRTTGRNSKGAIFELSKKSGEWSVSYWHDLNGASDGEIANRGFSSTAQVPCSAPRGSAATRSLRAKGAARSSSYRARRIRSSTISARRKIAGTAWSRLAGSRRTQMEISSAWWTKAAITRTAASTAGTDRSRLCCTAFARNRAVPTAMNRSTR
jgi:uncharacterized repeat protein (TIGR03803 family)